MNKNKLFKRLKKHKFRLQPKLPSLVKLVVPVKFFIQYFTNKINRYGCVQQNELVQLQIMKQLRDKLVFYLNHNSKIKLREQDLGNLLLASYVFRSALINIYCDTKSANAINSTINCLKKIYIYSAVHKNIAYNNLRKLEHVYGK